ncbi:MAG: ABC transporter permease subunit, partial [Rhodospirillaceae bacterium]|nr:ABC transporter permease subunit [Rhodospirillaceae bacterium]
MLSPLEIEALSLSLKVSLWAVAWSLIPGIAIAWLLARREFPGKALLDGLVHLPLVLPPVALGYVLLVLFGRNGPLGAWLHDWFGVNLVFSWRGAALAAAVMAFPLLVRAIRLSMEAVDQRLETAARTLGARPVRVFLTITLPLTSPGILTG